MASTLVGSIFDTPIGIGASILVVIPLVSSVVPTQVTRAVDVLNRALGSDIEPTLPTDGLLPGVLGVVATAGRFARSTPRGLQHAVVILPSSFDSEPVTRKSLGGIARFEASPRRLASEARRRQGCRGARGARFPVRPADRGSGRPARRVGHGCRPRPGWLT